jgi:RNA polymerase sigma-54 factor
MVHRLRQESRQQQTLTPRLQQAVRLLQLSSLDFAQEVNLAIENNPFLEPDEAEGDTPAGAAASAALKELLAPIDQLPVAAEQSEAPTDSSADGDWDMPWAQYGSGGSRRNNDGDGESDFSELTASQPSLREYLMLQAMLLSASPRDRALMAAIIDTLDDDGYLRLGLEEVQGLAELDPAPQDGEIEVALRLVQSLEPVGVAARDLKECLLLQLREVDLETPLRQLAAQMVERHLDRVAARDINALARALGRPAAQIERAAECIRHLEPRPGWRHGDAQTRYITPDIIVRKIRGEWTVLLNPDVVPRVRLNHVYADLFRTHRDNRHSDLAAHLQEARWTVRNVEQRFSTILRVGQAIVRRQRGFFNDGELAMRPLALREIADELGLHESTVSRVTNNKYMATPLGMFELKFFFPRALATASGGSCSTTAIRSAIKEMIATEDPRQPLSDAYIGRMLLRQGLQVARRTVTKYRQAMKLAPYEMRRRVTDLAA